MVLWLKDVLDQLAGAAAGLWLGLLLRLLLLLLLWVVLQQRRSWALCKQR